MRSKKTHAGDCRVCSGPIVREESRVYDPATGPPIFGPGSRQQFRLKIILYCAACGLSYHHLPLK